jgi:hypothetical protein
MSRSRKKMPIVGITTARSDQPYKSDEHRRERRTVRALLGIGLDADDRRLNRTNYGDPWKAPKDGKQLWSVPRALRK